MAISTIGGTAAGATDEGAVIVKSATLTAGNAKIVGPFSAGSYAIEITHGVISDTAVEFYYYIGSTPTLLANIPISSTTTSGTYAGKTTRVVTLNVAVDGFAIPNSALPANVVIKKFATGASGGFAYVPNISNPSVTTVNIGNSGYSMSFAYKNGFMAYGSYSGANAISNDDGASWGNVLNGDYTVASTDTHFIYFINNSSGYYTYPHGSYSANYRNLPFTVNPYGGNRTAYGNGVLVVFSGSNSVATSETTATNWTNTTGLAFTADTVVFDGTRFVATAGANTYTSTNGTSWTLASSTRSANHTNLYYGNGMYIAAPSIDTNTYFTSTDLISWTQRTNPMGNVSWAWAIYRNGAWGMGAYGQTPWGSYDGLNWTQMGGFQGTYQGGLNNSGRFYIWGWSWSQIHYNQNRNGVIA